VQLLKGSGLLLGGDGSLGKDSLGRVVSITTELHLGGGGVALGGLLVLLDAVLAVLLQRHGESSLEILGSRYLCDGDSDGVGRLGGVAESVRREGRVAPMLAHPLGRLCVEPLSESPNYFC